MGRVRSTVDLDRVHRKLRSNALAGGRKFALNMEGDAKDKAPWTDDTANARNSIQHYAFWDGDTLRVGILGHVSYFKHLELGMEKRWAILEPVVRAYVPLLRSWLGNLDSEAGTTGQPRTISEAIAASEAATVAETGFNGPRP